MKSVRRATESGVADVLAILLVVILATLAMVALVDATQDNSRHTPRTEAPQPAFPAADVTRVARQLHPAIVDIDAVLQSGGRQAATGMVLTPSGQVLTNNHVIAGATSITVRFGDGRTAPATVVGYDIVDDVAVLQADGISGLSPVDVGVSAAVVAGQPVVVLDGDRGVKASVRALGRDVSAGDAADPNGVDTRKGLIELAAPMQPMAAGGPVADAHGNVIAMRTAASAGRRFHEETADDISFATPIDRAREIVGEINAGHNTESVHVGTPATIGAAVRALPGGGSGALVVDVDGEGPAQGAGVVVNDVIASVDEVSVGSSSDVERVLNLHAPGDEVSVGWFDAASKYHVARVRLAAGVPA